MSDGCSDRCVLRTQPVRPRFPLALCVALIVNTVMLTVEIAGRLKSEFVSLLDDAVDFAGDAAQCSLSPAVLSPGLGWRARAPLSMDRPNNCRARPRQS